MRDNCTMSRIVIAGLGLIGGSIALALRARGREVAYLDPAVTLETAIARGAATERRESLKNLRADDLVVVATPVDIALELIDSLHGTTADVTSVCSVMAPLQNRAAAHSLRFVAGHPFAGSHTTGLESARADLFAGKSWFVDDQRDAKEVLSLIEECGAMPVRIECDEHDRVVALTSHLPQAISTALASLIVERGIPPELIGSGLQTLLRLADSTQSVWQPVIDVNRANLDSAAAAFVDVLRRVIDGDGTADFERANRFGAKSGG
jgi:prephenate dehydrogenase